LRIAPGKHVAGPAIDNQAGLSATVFDDRAAVYRKEPIPWYRE